MDWICEFLVSFPAWCRQSVCQDSRQTPAMDHEQDENRVLVGFSRSSKLNSIGRAHAPPRQRRAHIYAHLVCMVWFVKVWTVRYIGIVSHAWFYGSMDLWHDVHLTFIG